VLPRDHALIAEVLGNLGNLERRLGNYVAAEQHIEHALRMRETSLGSEHPLVAWSRSSFADLLAEAGDFARARTYYKRALQTYLSTKGEGHSMVPVVLNNLATLLRELGDYQEARGYFERSLAVRREMYGDGHPEVAMALDHLGTLLLDLDELDAAGAALRQACSIFEEPEHAAELGTERAWNLTHLGILDVLSGSNADARRRFQDAATVIEAVHGADHPLVAWALCNLAASLARSGDFEAANPLYERAATIVRGAFGEDHPLAAVALSGLAHGLGRTAKAADALDVALQAEAIKGNHVRVTARALSERQALRYSLTRASSLDLVLSLCVRYLQHDPTAVMRTWERLMKSRALVFDEMAARHGAMAAASDPVLLAKSDSLSAACRRLANLVIRGPDLGDPEGYRGLLDQTRREKERLESEIGERGLGSCRHAGAGFADVVDHVPPGSAMVGYVLYRQFFGDLPDSTRGRPMGPQGTHALMLGATGGVPTYAAFVHSGRGEPPALIPLAAASGIDSLVSRWRLTVQQGAGSHGSAWRQAEIRCRDAGRALRSAVWDPVAPHIEMAERIFVIPDGNLNLVSFAALPVGTSEYLLEQQAPIHYLSAERDILSFAEPVVTEGGLLVMGGPDFNAGPGVIERTRSAGPGPDPAGESAQRGAYQGGRPGCESFASMHFPPLPGSRREAELVAELWSTAHGGMADGTERAGATRPPAVLCLIDRQASEAAFKACAPGRRVIHVATHGFFLGGNCQSALGGWRGIGGIVIRDNRPPPLIGENPLLLSGLALAGANQREHAPEGKEDGILSAEEIGALRLDGVEWAVLSACDTGMGEIHAGEGVFGLRRAFRVAGARTVLMSLWPVEDTATELWMSALYEGRLTEGLDTAAAVRRASISLLHSLRAGERSTHPLLWGSFVATGDWR
jgi:CHAT domain-containing protein/tetratricopeptide (TPR) repeat protein